MERQYQCLRCGHDSRTHECEQIAHAKMVDLQRALDAEREKVKTLEEQLRLANCDQVNTENDLNDVTSQLATLQAQLEAAERHNTILQDANKVALEKVEALQAQLEQVQEERSKYIHAVGLATTCVADMQIDTSHPIEMMQEVCKRFTRRTAELEAVREQLRLANIDQANAEARANDLQQQVEALQRERDEWFSNSVAAEASANDLERDCKDLQSDIEDERAKAGNLSKKIAYWEKRHRTYMELAEENMNCKQAALDALKDAYDELERQHADLRSAFNAEREKVKGLHEITKVICTHCCEPMEIPSKAVLQTQLSQLQDWRDQVTLALQRAGGARFEDVPGHVKTVVDDLTQLQALVRAKEDAYEKILLSRERLEREMRGYPPVDNEGIPMVWQEPVGWVKRHPGRHDASNY